MSSYHRKLDEARVTQTIQFHRLTESIMHDLKERLDNIIEDHTIHEIDPPLFDMRNYILSQTTKNPNRDLNFKLKIIPLYNPLLDEIKKGLNQLLRHEYGLTEKARIKIKELEDIMKKLDLTVKYRIEFHDKNGKIEL